MSAATYRNRRRANYVSSLNPRGPRNRYAKALLSMQPGDSFTIRKEGNLRSNVTNIARYYRISITTRAESSDAIRVWRVDERAEIEPIVVRGNVPLPAKLTSAVELALRREAKRCESSEKPRAGAGTDKRRSPHNDPSNPGRVESPE
jgi:hypothetical protein